MPEHDAGVGVGGGEAVRLQAQLGLILEEAAAGRGVLLQARTAHRSRGGVRVIQKGTLESTDLAMGFANVRAGTSQYKRVLEY